MKIKHIKNIIKRIRHIESEESSENSDRIISYTRKGFKRMVYGIWHDGYNEVGDNMKKWMNKDALFLYEYLIENYKDEPEIKIKL